ncbi:TlpA family protein disulfide reductase [Mucilaginibacter sp. AW1-7]|uniref:TlpA family protein disulfide reductase n=1 Tax=Mucilaginibacter sp. AW1-7 TaxID=3349874 RepID=UPI003F73465E
MKTIIVYIIALCSGIAVLAQSTNKGLKEPEVGKPCPNFYFNKVDFYKSKNTSLADLKGKWIVLVFWSKSCSACIASFPQESRTQVDLGDRVQFVLVTFDTPEERRLYNNFHKKLNLAMPSAFDNEIFESFNVGGLPHTIIIDPAGVVRVITTASPSTEKLKELINGSSVAFGKASFADKKGAPQKFPYDRKIPFLVGGNGGIDSNFQFRSLFALWQPGNPIAHSWTPLFEPRHALMLGINGKKNVLEIIGWDLGRLYNIAYFGKMESGYGDTSYYGKYFGRPIFEGKNMAPGTIGRITDTNYYCYSLVVPIDKANKEFMMQVMQKDLKTYFNYDIRIENRKMPCWKLTANENAKISLETKGGRTENLNSQNRWQELHLRNITMQQLISWLTSYSGIDRVFDIVSDETNIKSNIDIDLNIVKGDYQSVKEALQKNGLDLEKGEKEMKVLVIRDPK